MREISVLNQKISYMQIKDEDYISNASNIIS